jgi:hypothetical protein
MRGSRHWNSTFCPDFFSQTPRTFNREYIRKQWDPAKIASAVDVVRKSEMGYLKARKLYDVPQTTLERPVNKRDIAPAVAVEIPLGRNLLCHEISRMISNNILYSWNSAFLGSQQYKFVNLPFRSLKEMEIYFLLTMMRHELVKIG